MSWVVAAEEVATAYEAQSRIQSAEWKVGGTPSCVRKQDWKVITDSQVIKYYSGLISENRLRTKKINQWLKSYELASGVTVVK